MWRAILVLYLAAACGGAAEPLPPSAPLARSARPVVAAEKVEVLEVTASRVGAAMRFDVRALGRGAVEGAPFEDPAAWTIAATQGERRLDRLVNGSVEVDRMPAGHDQWDTRVTFSVVFAVGDDGPIEVSLKPPGGDRVAYEFEP
jgi:hypothetical protein